MPKKQKYIQLFSIHGLVRAADLEMGRDADTGGQIKYVVELANHLSMLDDVKQVDLFTRLIVDKSVSDDYAQHIEKINDKCRIVRIQCGGRKYIRKELLWAHLPEYVDKTIKFIKKQNAIPDFVHGHYADAGYVAMQLSDFFGIPFIFTGHSLGRPKMQKLLNEGMQKNDIIKKYKIDTRINSEEEILKKADMVVTSTNQEIEEQYGMYDNKSLPKFNVIPPGIDIEKFYPFYHDLISDNKKNEVNIHAHASVLQELNRFFLKPDKPIILALCRPDKRKNISGLIKAYGEDLELQAMANLAIFAGIRKDIIDKEENERDVLTEMLLLMDKYDLYGKMAIPKKHNFDLEVPELYRINAESKGVFVNAALTEPFGLTLLEASACGVPIVATNDGGPHDIMKNCKNGVLIDPTNGKEISNAIKKIITNTDKWEMYSKNGIMNVRKHYTWEAHVYTYVKYLNKLDTEENNLSVSKKISSAPIGKRLAQLNHFLITDIDNTLIGENNESLDELLNILNTYRDKLGFAVATGRTIDSTIQFLKKNNVPQPDIIISSVGTEIYYGSNNLYDSGWDTHISHSWRKAKIIEILKSFNFLEYQEEATQRKYKVSYFMQPNKDRLASVHNLLINNKLKYNLVYSHNEFVDILPYRASKGKAIRYLSYKWEIPLENIVVCGDSGNDEEMLRGEPLGIIVGNYSDELAKLKGLRNIYFSNAECAGGIIEGLTHYRFLDKLQ